MHILYGHHNMYVYACHYCFEGFTSLEQLKKHCCEEFTQFMLQLLIHETKVLHFLLTTWISWFIFDEILLWIKHSDICKN